MINGAHVLIYSNDPDADRAFFRDVLQFRSVDAGGGWLIFELPPAEVAVHPAEEPGGIKTTIRLPSGGELGLYQPTHENAIGLSGRPGSG